MTKTNPKVRWILDSFSVEPGLRIPDSLNCVLDSNAQDSGSHSKNMLHYGFHKHKFPGLRKQDSPLHGANYRYGSKRERDSNHTPVVHFLFFLS